MFGCEENDFISLSELQGQVKSRIGHLQRWVQVEIESHRVVGGHHYLNVIEKRKDGEVVAKASARIWRSNEQVVRDFTAATGRVLESGLSIVVNAFVDYHPLYGLTLVISEIDSSCKIGERELEKQRTLSRLMQEGLLDFQKELALPFLPFSLAVISSESAAGYGDFCKHLSANPYGFVFTHELFPALMQGESAAASMVEALDAVQASGKFTLAIILR